MELLKQKTYSVFNFLAATIGSTALQFIALSFVAPSLIVFMFFNPVINNLIIAVVYGAIWLIIWTVLFNYGGEIKWFYFRVVFAMIPLLIWLYLYDPTPNPYAMIDFPKVVFLFSFLSLAVPFKAWNVISCFILAIVPALIFGTITNMRSVTDEIGSNVIH